MGKARVVGALCLLVASVAVVAAGTKRKERTEENLKEDVFPESEDKNVTDGFFRHSPNLHVVKDESEEKLTEEEISEINDIAGIMDKPEEATEKEINSPSEMVEKKSKPRTKKPVAE